MTTENDREGSDRRAFLKGAAASALLGSFGVGCSSTTASEATSADVTDSIAIGPLDPVARADAAFRIRLVAAKNERNLPLLPHPDNGDERRYPSKLANYSKALPHDAVGLVDLRAYEELKEALESGRFEDFERIPLGGTRKLVNPEAAYAFVLQGADSHYFTLPPAPTFTSAEQQSEAAEDYWHALLRDVPFNDYDSSPLAKEAAADLSRFSDFRGPKENGRVTTRTLFRWDAPGVLVGPYVSQFLLHDVPYGPQPFAQRNLTRPPGNDFLTRFDEWLAIQNGSEVFPPDPIDPIRRYMRDGRDLAEYVHLCQFYQETLNAALILSGFVPSDSAITDPSIFNPGNPYRSSRTQIGFATFGIADALDRLARVIVPALKAAWFQKWLVHRRLRPEEYGGRVDDTLRGRRAFPIGEELVESAALPLVFAKYGSYLLPQAYPEGCPTHPSYPAAHGTFVGASVTMVKAFFDESRVIGNPVVASDDGLSLLPFRGPSLTVGGELNKLAANIALGRDFAGVHWRSDSVHGLFLGEAIAIRVMADLRLLYTEPFGGFTFTKFDGTTITV